MPPHGSVCYHCTRGDGTAQLVFQGAAASSGLEAALTDPGSVSSPTSHLEDGRILYPVS